MPLSGSRDTKGDERHSRILSAALEVFSKSSFGEATTAEIARRARVSKRDLYAQFPDKHAILTKVIVTVLNNGGADLRRAIADSQKTHRSIEETLQIIGLALVSEILSPVDGFVCRLAFAESAGHPPIGEDYFKNWYSRRSQIVSQALSRRLVEVKGLPRMPYDKNRASGHFMALITHLLQLTVSLGMTGMWNSKSVQTQSRIPSNAFSGPILHSIEFPIH